MGGNAQVGRGRRTGGARDGGDSLRRGARRIGIPLLEHKHVAPVLTRQPHEVVVLLVLEGDQPSAVSVALRRVLHRRRRRHVEVLLPAGEERRLSVPVDRDRARPQGERTVGQRVPSLARRSQELPIAAQRRVGELVAVGEVAAGGNRRRRLQRERRTRRRVGNGGVAAQDHRPLAGPVDREEESLAPGVVEVAAIRARPEEDGPPVARRRLDEVGVTGRGDRVRARRVEVPLREDRVAGIRNVGTADRLAAKHHFGVVFGSPPFGGNEVVPPLEPQQVRRFDPDRLLREIHSAVDDHASLADHRLAREVVLLDPDGAMSVVARRLVRRAVVHHPRAAVVVEEDVGVDALEAEEVGLRPGALRVVRRHDEAATPVDQGGDHVEDAVAIADRRGEDPARDAGRVERKL